LHELTLCLGFSEWAMFNLLTFVSIKLFTMGKFGVPEILLILAIVLLLFGGKKIPELMKGLGKGVKEFKDASKGEAETKTEEKNQ
jgi:sec-independent protein translocase protein TatA